MQTSETALNFETFVCFQPVCVYCFLQKKGIELKSNLGKGYQALRDSRGVRFRQTISTQSLYCGFLEILALANAFLLKILFWRMV